MADEASGQPSDAPTECSVFEKCGKCSKSITTKQSKLLPCLHNLCFECWNPLQLNAIATLPGTIFNCPECKQKCRLSEVIDNLFVSFDEEVKEAEEKPSLCTSCDENSDVSSFCMDCVDWLCDQCVQAHRRVKITKDHKIVAKDMVAEDLRPDKRPEQRTLFCPEHHQEEMKLYCETCQQLTCRDCQLENHKDHKYAFLKDASEQYHIYLKTYMMKLKEKMNHVDKAKALIESRSGMIRKREEDVEKEIRTFATKLMYEIQNRGRTLITDLKALCKAKKTQLVSTGQQVEVLYHKLCHSLKFVEGVMDVSDHVALLHSRKLIVKQLTNITMATCEVPNPNHNIDIRFKPHGFASHELRVGSLLVDGTAYAGLHPKNDQKSAPQQPSSRRQEVMRTVANLPPEQREQYMRVMLGQHASGASLANQSKNIRLAPKPPGQHHIVTAPLRSMLPVNQIQHRHSTGGSTVHHQPQPVYQYIVNQQTPTVVNSTVVQPDTNGHVPMQISSSRIVGHPSAIFTSQAPVAVHSPSIPAQVNHRFNTEPTRSPNNLPDLNSHENTKPKESESPPESMMRLKEERLSVDEKPEDHVPETDVNVDMAEPPNLFDDMHPSGDELMHEPIRSNMIDSPRRERPEKTENTGNSFPISDQMLADDDDPSEDFCAVCHNGGDLLCCDTCPKVFHLACHVPYLETNPSGEWQCGLCSDLGADDTQRMDHNGKRKAPTGLSDYEIKVCERILLLLLCHQSSPPFHEPVSKSVPNYYKVITNPMDFTNIKCKLSRAHFNHYDSVQDFISDVKLVFSNCATYNAAESPVCKAGEQVEESFGDLLHEYLPHEVTRQTSSHDKPVSKRKKKPEDIVHYQA